MKKFFTSNEINNTDLTTIKIVSEFNCPLKRLPSQIFNLINLERLEFKMGKIEEIPDDIGRLVKLKELFLQSNKIGRISTKIAQLTKLKKLRLFDNKITDISPICSIPNLLELEIGRNEIKFIPDEIGNLKKIQKLDLGNLFYSNTIEYISDQIGLLTNLKSLSIHGARLPLLNKSIGDLVELRTLSIRNSQVKEIGFVFNRLNKMEVLDLTNNDISNICLDFSKAISLKSIYFDNNPVNEIPESILDLPKIELIGIAGTSISQDSLNNYKRRYPHIKFLTAKDYFAEVFQK